MRYHKASGQETFQNTRISFCIGLFRASFWARVVEVAGRIPQAHVDTSTVVDLSGSYRYQYRG